MVCDLHQSYYFFEYEKKNLSKSMSKTPLYFGSK